MRITEIIWKERFIDKIARKHNVTTREVEEVLFGRPRARRIEKGKVAGEDEYLAYGRTGAGRLLVVFFIRKRRQMALPISARDMTHSEKRYYESQK